MAGEAVEWGARYWAFVSYSHQDAAFGRRLHRRLENYALPRRLVGRNTTGLPVPRRLNPIFRDREEFAAAHDLSAEVRTALEASRSLIVVCSPAAAASLWVSREIDLFRSLHPDRPILAALREGEPAQSLPPALRRSGPDGRLIEPLAADFRRGRDGDHLALLKLVAGVVGVGLDELIQRDATRRLQRVTAVTAAALVAMLGMGALAAFAWQAQAEAERQRAGGEGLVRFMYTDLREGLKGVGRLPLMAAVNARALAYYDRQGDALSPTSRAQRARILQAIGEDDETRGQPGEALKNFQEAASTTSALLAATPDDPDRIFDQAQSEFWLGYDAYVRGHYAATKARWLAYRVLARRLVASAPRNPWYLRELGYAEGDLCTVAFKLPDGRAETLRACRAAVTYMEEAARLHPSDSMELDVSREHSWLSDAYRYNNDTPHALAERLVEEKLLGRLIAADPENLVYRGRWIPLQRVLARYENEAGNRQQALDRLAKALSMLNDMIAFDPANQSWIVMRSKLEADVARVNRQTVEGRLQ